MKAGLAKQILTASGAAVISLAFSLMPLARAYATSPYLKVSGGDISSGGWFNDSAGGSCIGSNFQDNNYKNDNSYGGIYTFADNPGGGYRGSSSAYAAFSLGQIDNSGGAPNGFYSGAALTQPTPSTLSFANINSLNPPGFIGGLWGGAARYAEQCIPDYYDTKKPASATPLGSAGFNTGNATGTAAYTMDGTASPVTLMSADTMVAAGANISIFVNGNLYINHNIFYANHDTTNIPRLALVVQGSIYIDPGVSQLDGLYIAQPDASKNSAATAVADDTGMVWTCHDGGTGLPSESYVLSYCNNNNPLTINGAVIAKQVNLLRLTGDLSSSAAEVFNFTPEMMMAGPFFPTAAGLGGSGGAQPVFQSILSLPPVF